VRKQESRNLSWDSAPGFHRDKLRGNDGTEIRHGRRQLLAQTVNILIVATVLLEGPHLLLSAIAAEAFEALI
jgi:hypothetical protein